MTRAGVSVSARTASARGTPAPTTVRSATSCVSVDPAMTSDPVSAEVVIAVGRIGSGHRVGDESDPPGRRAERQGEDRRIHVHAVRDEFEHDAFVLDGRRDGAGRAVMDAGHRVEGMGEERRPRGEATTGVIDVADGVAHGDDGAGRAQRTDRLDRVRQFGRDRDLQEPPVGGVDQPRHGPG
jgi:hypothetical protein